MTQLDLFPAPSTAVPTPPHLLAIIRNADDRYSNAEIAAACRTDARLATAAWYADRAAARQAA